MMAGAMEGIVKKIIDSLVTALKDHFAKKAVPQTLVSITPVIMEKGLLENILNKIETKIEKFKENQDPEKEFTVPDVTPVTTIIEQLIPQTGDPENAKQALIDVNDKLADETKKAAEEKAAKEAEKAQAEQEANEAESEEETEESQDQPLFSGLETDEPVSAETVAKKPAPTVTDASGITQSGGGGSVIFNTLLEQLTGGNKDINTMEDKELLDLVSKTMGGGSEGTQDNYKESLEKALVYALKGGFAPKQLTNPLSMGLGSQSMLSKSSLGSMLPGMGSAAPAAPAAPAVPGIPEIPGAKMFKAVEDNVTEFMIKIIDCTFTEMLDESKTKEMVQELFRDTDEFLSITILYQLKAALEWRLNTNNYIYEKEKKTMEEDKPAPAQTGGSKFKRWLTSKQYKRHKKINTTFKFGGGGAAAAAAGKRHTLNRIYHHRRRRGNSIKKRR